MTVRGATPTYSEQPFVRLYGISWETYELLLHDLQEESLRLTYDEGRLVFDRRGADVGVIEPISIETYESLLRDIGNRPIRLTYDEGRLWIMSPTHRHDKLKKLIGSMVEMLALELRIPLSRYGSATWHRANTEKGLEPDEAYYVQNELKVRGKDDIDLEKDPPPDLVVEVEVTNPLLPRLPILAALGVREIWHYKRDALRALKLEQGGYVPITTSLAFPMIKPADLDEFLKMRHATDETTLMVAFQEWARNVRPTR